MSDYGSFTTNNSDPDVSNDLLGRWSVETSHSSQIGLVGNMSNRMPNDPDVTNQLNALLTNNVAMRQELFRRLLDPRRDIEDECGHPKEYDLNEYQWLYDWDAIARRVVEVLVKESWQVQPSVYEKEEGEGDDAEDLTAWEQAWKELRSSLGGINGQRSYFADEQGSQIWNVLKQADTLCGIGCYSVIVLGLEDQADPSTPVKPRQGMGLRYLRVFGEQQARIKTMETDELDPRFGKPTLYTITFHDPGKFGDSQVALIERDVHWTRVIHVSEGHVNGQPRMRPVLNRILDLRKLYGGSAEMYWKGAFPGLSLETDPKLGGDVDYDKPGLKSMMEQYMNGLQRYLALNGFTAKTLSPQVVDPTPQITVQIEAICIYLGIPVRIFKGSERGELASNQDDSSWNDRLRERQNAHNTPNLVIPLISHLIWLGVLPEPQESLHVYWPDLDSQTEDQKALIALKVTQAITQFASAGGEGIITPYWFLTEVLGWTSSSAKAALEATQQAVEDRGDDHRGSALLNMVGGVTAMVELFKLAQSGGLTEEQLKQQIMLFYGLDEAKAQEMIADGLNPPALPAPAPMPGTVPGQPQPSLPGTPGGPPMNKGNTGKGQGGNGTAPAPAVPVPGSVPQRK